MNIVQALHQKERAIERVKNSQKENAMSDNMKPGMIKLGGLWKEEGRDGSVFFAGRLGIGGKMLIFKNQYKRGDKDSDLILYVTPAEKKEKPEATERKGDPFRFQVLRTGEMYSPVLRLVRLLSKRYAFLLGPQSIGHLEFLPKLAQVPVSSAVNYINIIKHKENQEYQQEYGLSSQEAQDDQDEQYSNPNIKDNSLFTVLLDFEGLPFVELGLINAREIGSGKFLDARIIHILPLNWMSWSD
jgi:hypothetical protein